MKYFAFSITSTFAAACNRNEVDLFLDVDELSDNRTYRLEAEVRLAELGLPIDLGDFRVPQYASDPEWDRLAPVRSEVERLLQPMLGL